MLFLSSLFWAALPEDPEFTDIIENITVPAGRNIKLACSVKNLGSYKVRTTINETENRKPKNFNQKLSHEF